MVTLVEIKECLLGSRTPEEEAAANTFLEILEVISFRDSPIENLDSVLQAIEPLLPIAEAFDQKHTSTWSQWASTIAKIREIFRRNLISNLSTASLSKDKTAISASIWRGKAGKFPDIACLVAEIDKEAPTGLIAAKAILLINLYQRFVGAEGEMSDYSSNYSKKYLADTLRKCCSLKWQHVGLAERFLPEWPLYSAAEWKDLFISGAPRRKNIRQSFLDQHEELGIRPTNHDFNCFYTMQEILSLASAKQKQALSSPKGSITSMQTASLRDPHLEISSSVVTDFHFDRSSELERKAPNRPTFDVYPKLRSSIDAASDALSPRIIHVIPQQDTTIDQPLQLPSIQSLDVRYANYRTAMDNQRLPWQWDCLNPFEIKAVQAALLVSSERQGAPQSEKHGAFIVWLLLATGQTIEEILHFGLGRNQSNRSAIVAGPIYIRSIIAPPHSFVPKSEQQNYLHSHSSSVALALPSPFPTLVTELGLVDSNIALIKARPTIGAYLNLNKERAEQAVRLFLENHRTRSFRLLPGRIRNVLSKEIMRVSNDPVATHILSSLPTDMPPAGVYYTSYSKEQLESIYATAVALVLGEDT